jgi:hypothetical protein
MSKAQGPEPPPRVLIVMSEQWRRSLLRAALREVGYDAVGASALSSARRIPAIEPNRVRVGLIIVDQPALRNNRAEDVARLTAAHAPAPAILLARSMVAVPSGPWRRILPRPLSIADVVTEVQSLLPLAQNLRHPLD